MHEAIVGLVFNAGLILPLPEWGGGGSQDPRGKAGRPEGPEICRYEGRKRRKPR